jgi:hypothetical protein
MKQQYDGSTNVEAARERGRELMEQARATRARDMAQRTESGLAHPTSARAKTLAVVRNHQPLVDWADKGWTGTAGVS